MGCEAFLNGWVTVVDIGSDLENALLHSGRPYTTSPYEDELESLIRQRVYTFAPGTPCFRASQHRSTVRPDVPQLFVVRGGDWRGNPTGERRVHQRPEDWVEDFAEHTQQLADRIEKG